MAQSESKDKLGNRGTIRGEKTFNTKSGTNKSTFQTTWEGTTKGNTVHKKQKNG